MSINKAITDTDYENLSITDGKEIGNSLLGHYSELPSAVRTQKVTLSCRNGMFERCIKTKVYMSNSFIYDVKKIITQINN
ncbi:hypothetical protein JN11_04899 [Mucilaginibacter frigoritolerans]|uniref:Uncharacterized protein n=1 Tax=Mucilaginibacter frigoritolerans TaxID=652788 RepID=A0A562TKW8_9SPHI|nr:hypothetical protein JN11_04899 [Mucilaginibacter frigoritolerans]